MVLFFRYLNSHEPKTKKFGINKIYCFVEKLKKIPKTE